METPWASRPSSTRHQDAKGPGQGLGRCTIQLSFQSYDNIPWPCWFYGHGLKYHHLFKAIRWGHWWVGQCWTFGFKVIYSTVVWSAAWCQVSCSTCLISTWCCWARNRAIRSQLVGKSWANNQISRAVIKFLSNMYVYIYIYVRVYVCMYVCM